MTKDHFVPATTLGSIHKLRYWVCTIARAAQAKIERRNPKSKTKKFEMICKPADINVLSSIPKEYLLLKLGPQKTRTTRHHDIFRKVREVINENEFAYSSSSDSECDNPQVGDNFPSTISRLVRCGNWIH